MINPNNIVDNMKPFEYRFNKNKEFIENVLPFTKYIMSNISLLDNIDRKSVV